MAAIFERLTEAQNAHDAVGMASLFAADYRSVQPAHPGRAFGGSAQVLANWTRMFDSVPDFRSELLAVVVDGDTEWGEVRWSGHHLDGATFEMCGVAIMTVRNDLVAELRLYVEPVERRDEDIEAAVDKLTAPPSHPSS